MKLPDDPQMSLSFRALGRGCRGPSRRSSWPRPNDRSPSRGSAPHAIRPSPLSEPADADPDPGPHLRHWEATSLAMESGSGGGRGEAIRNVYFDFRSPAASRARSWRRLRRGSPRPAAWLTAMQHFG